MVFVLFAGLILLLLFVGLILLILLPLVRVLTLVTRLVMLFLATIGLVPELFLLLVPLLFLGIHCETSVS